MKTKHNKTYAGKPTQRIKKRRRLVIAGLIITAVMTVAINKAYAYLFQWEAPEINIYQPKIESELEIYPKEEPMKEWVLKTVYEAGLNPEEIDCLIENESGWNDYAYNVNWHNGTTDMGLWMINSIHKGTIDVRDRLDYKKATYWAIDKIKRDGNYNAWYGYSKCK